MTTDLTPYLREWELRSQKSKASGSLLLRAEIDSSFKAHFPHISDGILAVIHDANVRNCEKYITSMLIGQYGFTLLRTEHFLLVENDPLQFCFETIQLALDRIKTVIGLPSYYIPSVNYSQIVAQSPISQSAQLPLSRIPMAAPPSLSQSTSALPSSGSFIPLSASTSASGLSSSANSLNSQYLPPVARSSISGPPGSQLASSSSSQSVIQGPPSSLKSSVISGPPVASSSGASSSAGDKSSSPAKRSKDVARCRWEVEHNFCRTWNLKFLLTCPSSHMYREGSRRFGEEPAPTKLIKLSPTEAKYKSLSASFLGSWSVGTKPTIDSIEEIYAPTLAEYFKKADAKLSIRDGATATTDLYHGTCEANFPVIFKYGLQLPSDYEVNPSCKECGHLHKHIKTSTCLNNCKDCAGPKAVRHNWNKCHMFGLGIYFADQTSKADRYVRNKKGEQVSKGKKMLITRVCLGVVHEVRRLTKGDELHDLVAPPGKKNSVMAIGTGSADPQNLSVMNNESSFAHRN